jgi:hypothetical protein
MVFDIRTPPNLTGRYYRDIPLVYNWCTELTKKLKAMFAKIEDNQIVSVSASKIGNGIIELNSGGRVEIGDDLFSISNSDGSQYIRLEGDKLVVKATVEA